MELEPLRKSMKKVLSESRYRHSLEVEEVCYDLALIHGEDTLKAAIAGILHDCAKCMTDMELLQECEKYNLPITQVQRKQPYLLHASLGAVYAREKYGIRDEDILNAITYHTTGRPAMTKLEKIVYIADFIEPGRKPIPVLDEAREMAYRNLDEAVICIADNSLNYLKEKGVIIEPLTKETYDYYLTNMIDGETI